MRVTTKGRYALRAVTQLAVSYTDKPISIKELAKTEDLSPEFLEQIFFKLRKSGLINSTRGPGGGFSLDKKASEISIKDVFEAVGEGIDLTPCTEKDGEDCKNEGHCVAHGIWEDASAYIRDYFANLSIQDVIDSKKSI